MNKVLLLVSTLLLAGCIKTAVPVTTKFPTAPDVLRTECDDLIEVAKDTTLSEFTKTVVLNYMKYHECKAKNKSWIEWHDKQKKIYEQATKR